MRRLTWLVLAIGLFLIGMLVGRVNGPSCANDLLDLSRVNGQEASRVTDPTGHFDAVVLSEAYGPGGGGGVNWYVAIVPQGKPAALAREAVMIATKRERALWREPHLLEIHYDRADILDFTNLWSSNVLHVLSIGEPYWIEVRPVPGSALVTADGRLR